MNWRGTIAFSARIEVVQDLSASIGTIAHAKNILFLFHFEKDTVILKA